MDTQDRDRMTTLGELSAILAHEIKNPMNSIIINMEVLRTTVDELTRGQQNSASEKAERYLGAIEGEVKRLDKVIKGFLDISNPPQPTKTSFDLNRLIRNIAEFMKLEMEKKNVSLHLNLSDSLKPMHGSPDQIKQALLNLLLNAAQAMPNGGQVKLQTAYDGKTIQLEVSDTGEGISPEVREKIFSPYFTTKERGSGLGLTIVRRIIREHNGFIDVHSEKNKGTKFIINLPVKENENENADHS